MSDFASPRLQKLPHAENRQNVPIDPRLASPTLRPGGLDALSTACHPGSNRYTVAPRRSRVTGHAVWSYRQHLVLQATGQA